MAGTESASESHSIEEPIDIPDVPDQQEIDHPAAMKASTKKKRKRQNYKGYKTKNKQEEEAKKREETKMRKRAEREAKIQMKEQELMKVQDAIECLSDKDDV